MYFKINFFAVISCLLCTYCAAESTTNTTKLLVSIYYETYCPDSIKFITKDFFPVYQKLNATYITPHFVPFGNANYTTENGTTTFSCQHGEKECQGNKAHACVLSSPDIPFAKQLSFINCTMSLTDTKSNETYPTTRCATEANINSLTLSACLNNDTKASAVLLNYGEVTKKNKIESVPFVIFNDKYDADKSKMAVNNFGDVLCKDYFQNDKNASQLLSCNNPSNGSASTMTLTALPVIVFTYLVSKMY